MRRLIKKAFAMLFLTGVVTACEAASYALYTFIHRNTGKFHTALEDNDDPATEYED